MVNLGILSHYDNDQVALRRLNDNQASSSKKSCDILSECNDGSCHVIFLGRLYYLNDLCRKLANETPQNENPKNAQYVLATYHHGGVNALEWLEGDYVFVLWDSNVRQLVATRDPGGAFPLFWASMGGQVAISTTMSPLFTLLNRRVVNQDYFADFLVSPGAGMQELNDEKCAYEGINRVVAGTRLEIKNRKISISHWWNWAEKIQEPRSLRMEAISEEYRYLLSDSIQERRIGRTAAHLSGGMDSTSVAILAARQAKAKSEEPVYGLSMIYSRFKVLSQETPYIESVLNEPNLKSLKLTGENYLDFDGYAQDFSVANLNNISPDEPVASVWQATTNYGPIKTASNLGVQTLLTGLGADEFLCVSPNYLHDLVKEGHWLRAWKESANLAQGSGVSRWRYFGPFAIGPFFPCLTQAGLYGWWHSGSVNWEKQQQCTIAPWILPKFSKRFQLWQRTVKQQRRAFARSPLLSLSFALESLERNIGDAVRWEFALPQGVFIAHPFRDPRLVRFCLGWQGKLWADPQKQKEQKPILEKAMRDVLPEVIRKRRRKGHFNEVLFAGLSKNLPTLETLIKNAPVDDLEIFDKQSLLNCLQKAALGIGNNSFAVAKLGISLCLLKWLTQARASSL